MTTLSLCDWCGCEDSGGNPGWSVLAVKINGSASSYDSRENPRPDWIAYPPLVCWSCRNELWSGDFEGLAARRAMRSETITVPVLSFAVAPSALPVHRKLKARYSVALAAIALALVGLFCLGLAVIA